MYSFNRIELKPDRQPDFIAQWGAAFWWCEMIYMTRDNFFHLIRVEETDTGRELRIVELDGSSKLTINRTALMAYDEWNSEFDRIVLEND